MAQPHYETETRADYVERALAYGDSALGLAGHQVADSRARELITQALKGEITSEELTALLRENTQG